MIISIHKHLATIVISQNSHTIQHILFKLSHAVTKKKNPFLWSHPIIEAFFVVKNENLSMLNASNFLSIGQGKCYVAHLKYSVTPDNFSSYKFVFYALMAQCSFCLANALIPSIQTG